MGSSYYKLDLHTHSIRSSDGSITKQQYKDLLERKILDVIAITDHDTVEQALDVQQSLGNKIIVGEEIRTAEGEVIGLFLEKGIPPGLSLEKTFALIKEQNGIIYLPHPFSRNRSGVKETTVLPILDQVDIIEYFNPRNFFRSDNDHARRFALQHRLIMAASSDGHCVSEIGMSYSTIRGIPTRSTLVSLLSDATYVCRYPAPIHLLCPKKNKIKKLLRIL